jgi:hypothetical protein
MPENGAAVNGDVATCNNTQHRVTKTKERLRTKPGELVPIVQADSIHSPSGRDCLKSLGRPQTEASRVLKTGRKSSISMSVLTKRNVKTPRRLLFRQSLEEVFSETELPLDRISQTESVKASVGLDTCRDRCREHWYSAVRPHHLGDRVASL